MITIFLDNKYTHWYHSIIRKAQQRIMEGYSERHHIIPKCFYKMNSGWGTIDGDSEVADNKVTLTIKEHYIVHLLLTKMVSGKVKQAQMNLALERCLNINNKGQTGRYKIGARKYQHIRQAAASAVSIFMSSDSNPMLNNEVRAKSKKNTKIAMNMPDIRENFMNGINSKSWRDARSKRVGANAPRVDKSSYLFVHKDGRLFEGTQMELRQLYNVSTHVTDLIKGRISSVGGWELFYSPGAPNKRYKNKT